MLKEIRALATANLRLHGCNIRIRVHIRQQRFQPSLRRLYIRIEEYHVVTIYPLNRTVISLGKTVVTVQHYGLNTWELIRQHRQAVIRTAIIRNDEGALVIGDW